MKTPRQVELRYSPQEIESRWQQRWQQDEIYKVVEDDPRPKWYELHMYPYPSGNLHIGHWYAMSPADAHARFRRMQGFNVLHPMGFDAFGLPAENAAIKHGIHPHTWTMDNIENMRRQLRSMGPCYDWSREIICALPKYYQWNQWFFLKLYNAGLAYRALAPANWCPSCQTVLANEQVVDGNCERCDTTVTRKDLSQWFFRITKYADELLDFSLLQWPQKILAMQRNWIGRSEGVNVSFDISHLGIGDTDLETFTTRVDTLFGVTFMVLAPEHPLVDSLTSPDRKVEVELYREQARQRTEIERLSTEREKTGVPLGNYCINRVNGEQVPIFIGDYTLMMYGTGAVMGVPAHDERDHAFAKKYQLPIRVVVAPPGWDGNELTEAYTGEGDQVNSGFANGLPNAKGASVIADQLEKQGWGKRTISYRLRDWLISRQRYWGTPIPIIYCNDCGAVPVPVQDLPVLLPEDAEFRPTGESPLTRHQEFLHTTCPNCNAAAKRETDTMDTFVDSSWYFLRYISPNYEDGPFDPKLADQWCPVDQYTGGAEHAVMHLLYARFFIKALRDLGIVHFDEPFLRLFNQGHIIAQQSKMSKSRGNVVTPDPYVAQLGADVVRVYLMFLGPWDQGGEWSDSGLNGIARWLNRIWDLVHRDITTSGQAVDLKSTDEFRRRTHRTIKRFTGQMDAFQFNTAVATLMEFTNFMGSIPNTKAIDVETWSKGIDTLLLLLAPMAPHISEELWSYKHLPYSIHQQRFPEWVEEFIQENEVTFVIQVNGKVRDRIQMEAETPQDKATEIAFDSPNVQRYIATKSIARVIYVPGRLLNIVVE